MKRSQPEPGNEMAKCQSKQLFTVADVLANFDDFEELEADNDADYPDSDLESVTEIDIECSTDSDSDVVRIRSRPRSSQSVDLGGRGPRPSGDSTTVQTNNNGDLDLEWTENYTPGNTYFDDRHCGPRNVLPNINEESTPKDFIGLFLDTEFWENLTAMTNLCAKQAKEETPNKYYCKTFQEVTVEEMMAFIGLRLEMEHSVIKPQYCEYWQSEGKNFLSHTPGFRKVMVRDCFLAIWTYLHAINEKDQTIDKTDKIYKVRPILNTLLEKFRHYYLPKQFF